jgi:hypothetical protein
MHPIGQIGSGSWPADPERERCEMTRPAPGCQPTRPAGSAGDAADPAGTAWTGERTGPMTAAARLTSPGRARSNGSGTDSRLLLAIAGPVQPVRRPTDPTASHRTDRDGPAGRPPGRRAEAAGTRAGPGRAGPSRSAPTRPDGETFGQAGGGVGKPAPNRTAAGDRVGRLSPNGRRAAVE